MSTRRFWNVEYPIPGFEEAIHFLRPGIEHDGKFIVEGNRITYWEDPQGREPPSTEECREVVKYLEELYDYYLYERERDRAYPPGDVQMDMLYHDIKNGNLENGSWIQSMDSVREKFPKPEGPPPPNDIPDNVRG